ncbi:sugar ABC transporter permease [Streptomyces sp. PSKA54]|uniref:Sugar ABC transporter permease n=1 Tax=Streptomyces himalayensis subsp. aureolus TaxID=2758039 RepID=A0A7W2D9W8_9ACTN|nr:sugar ABC transporter permease [Streptomyces himalayensis]MBA4867326.1 sugar ABC transporter permease [Streptomyces himalayensis subsp. aureolus]
MSTGQLTDQAAGTGETSSSPSRRPARAPRRPASLRTRRARAFYVFTLPWVVSFLALTAFPLGYALWLSFTNADGLSNNSRFVGLDNYKEVFTDPETMSSLARTGVFTAITVPLGILAGLLLAVLVNQPIRARGLFRTLLYLPAVVPPVGAALTFKLIFDRDSGAANGLLDIAGINGINWLVDPYARWVLIVLTMWAVGNGMIISLAGLQDIPRELNEAARVDGASPWQSFTRITLPLLSPVIFFQVVTGIIASLQTFMPLLIALDPTPRGVSAVPESNYFYMIHVFAQYFANGRYGYASALLWVLFAIICVVTFLIFKLSKGAVFYSVEPEQAKSKPRTIGDSR